MRGGAETSRRGEPDYQAEDWLAGLRGEEVPSIVNAEVIRSLDHFRSCFS